MIAGRKLFQSPIEIQVRQEGVWTAEGDAEVQTGMRSVRDRKPTEPGDYLGTGQRGGEQWRMLLSSTAEGLCLTFSLRTLSLMEGCVIDVLL